jgi:tetratricopeptide (TPR) repeat protein
MKKNIFLVLLLLWAWTAGAAAEKGLDPFARAKVLIFDKEWASALKLLDEVIAGGAGNRNYATALFYRGKCLEEVGEKKNALESYERFVTNSAASNLAEEARVSIIDLADALVQGGEKDYLQKIVDLLNCENKVVSFYAAFKLSYFPDRRIAARALPVLQVILDSEKDEELRDRARIAVMRIEPERLKAMDRRDRDVSGRMLHILIFEKNKSQANVSLSIPLALADLALNSLSQEQKRSLKKQGYNLDDIMDKLTSGAMTIDITDNGSVIKIWVK